MNNDVIMGWDAAWPPKGGGAWAEAVVKSTDFAVAR